MTSSYHITGDHHDIHQIVTLVFFKKFLKPMSRELSVSFKIISVINEVNSKTHCVAGNPFKVVQK